MLSLLLVRCRVCLCHMFIGQASLAHVRTRSEEKYGNFSTDQKIFTDTRESHLYATIE